MSMFESKVYQCLSCSDFYFFKLDADEHTSRTGHKEFKVSEWNVPPRQTRLNRIGSASV